MSIRGNRKKKRVLSFVLALMMTVGLFHAVAPSQNAEAAVSDAPAAAKNLYDNGDGTYTLSLSVTGEAASSTTTQVSKANVILVVDTSNSMNNSSGSTSEITYTEFTGTPNWRDEYYGIDNDGDYMRVYWRNNAYRLSNYNYGTVYEGTVYTRSGGDALSRIEAEKNALTKDDGIIDSLLAQNVAGDSTKSDIIEVAIVNFGTEGHTAATWSTDGDALKATVNALTTSTGTNWEGALDIALEMAAAKKTSESTGGATPDPTYIIFLTDGQPTTDETRDEDDRHDVNTNYGEEWGYAKDEARQIITDGYTFYGIFTWGSAQSSAYLSSLVNYAYTGRGTYTTTLASDYSKYFTNATSTEEVIAALQQAINDITESVGYTNVELEDGVTSMTTSSVKASVDGDVTGITYYRAGGDYGEAVPANGVYGTEWEDAPKATINEDGEIDWDLGDIVLEDGVTYTMTFVVWPSQESVDLVADLNNGVISYDDLTDDQKSQIAVSGGHYTLKTNTDYPSVTYSTVTTTTVTDEEGNTQTETVVSDPQTATITNPDPVGLAESKLNAKKSWEDTLDPSQREEIEDVVLYLLVDGEYYYKDENGDPLGVTLTEESNWEETDYISIAPGLLVAESSPAYDSTKTQVTWEGVTYAIMEAGHEYVFEESDINNHFELTAYTHHPMIMGENEDGSLHIVDIVFTKDASGNITGIESVSEMGDNLSATNTLKPGINIQKKVVDASGEEIDNTDPFEVTVYVVDETGGALPTKQTADGTGYTIDYRIYYGPNNPNYDASSGGGRSNHIYRTGTSFTETLYVGDVIRVVNVEAGSLFRVEETESTGYELTEVKYEISNGSTSAYAEYAEDDAVTLDGETYYPTEGNSASQVTLTNTYTYGALKVSKTVEVESGDEEQAKEKEFEFTFRLYSDDTKATELTGLKYNYTITDADGEVTTGTITEGGTFKLKDGENIVIDMLPEGAYYEVTETAATGYETTKTGDTGSIVKDETAKAAFTNTYSVTSVIVDPPVKKDITGNEDLYNQGDFTFTIENTSAPDGVTAPMPENTSITNSETYEKEGKTGYYEFGEIEFTVPGQYVYTVTESGSVLGVTNDSEATKTITFTVTDNGEGALTVTPGTESAVFNFTNVYKTGELDITKTVVNEANDSDATEFTFTVTLTDAQGNAVEGSFPYTIGETEGDIASGGTLKLQNGETAIIVGIPDGTQYTVVETEASGYTTTKTGDSGSIDSDTPAEAAFINTYSAAGEATITVTKALSGAAWPTDKNLTVTISGSTGAPMPDTTSATVTAAGDISFGPIAYDLSDVGKTYTYTISEGDGFGDEWTGSGDITATVVIANEGDGTLTATVTYSPEDATITNTYEASGEAVLEVTKAIAGAAWPSRKTLTLTLSGEGGTLPETNTVSLTAEGKATFGAITYTEADIGKTYTYTISEGDGFGDGWTGTGDITATVTVTDNGDGTLDTEITYSPESATITNTYTATGSISLTAGKELVGRAWKPDETVTFTLLDPDGNTYDTQTIGENGTVTFKTISYTEADAGKTYVYTISETSRLPDGVTSSNDIEAHVTVTDNGDGTLTPEVTYTNGDKITNTYRAESVKAQINVSKVIEGYIAGEDANGNVVDRTFTFTMTGPKIDGELTTTVTTSGGTGTASFDEIEYTFEDMVDDSGNRVITKTFTYEVKETEGNDNGFTYDEDTYEVVVTVEDNQDGKLIVTEITKVDDETNANVEIVNEFNEAAVEVILNLTKVIEDQSESAEDATFTFQLLDAEEKVVEETTITTDGLTGTTQFEPITFEAAGTYEYVLREIAPAAASEEEPTSEEGESPWTYDTKEYPVVITVTDNFETAKLEASVTIDGAETTSLTVTNIYKAASTDATLYVIKEVEDTSGSAYETTFEFTLKDAEGKTIGTGSVEGPGEVYFDAITYEKAGTYEYTITETAGDAAGYTYDTTEYPVTVTVEDVDGKLVATVSYGKESATELTVTNIYDPKDAEAAPQARKVVEDNSDSAPDETFTFELLDAGENVVETVTIENGGYVNFSTLTFDKVGTYEYKIREVAGSTKGYTYDTEARSLQIEVTDDGTGILSAAITYMTDEGEIVITNSYTAEPTSITLDVTKKVEGLSDGGKAQEFSFDLYDSDSELIETINITGAGSASFSEIEYTKAGTYNYTVSEKSGNAAGYTYDSAKYTVTVTVTDEGGKLAAEVEIKKDGEASDAISFTNVYEAESVSVPFSGMKVLNGRALKIGEFLFRLEIDGVVAEDVTNRADGTFSFADRTFDEAGTYTFKIYEINNKKEYVTYDETVYEGSITVTDNGEGQLVAVVEGNEGIVFMNSYEKPAESPTPPTGDENNPFLWLMVMLAAGAGLAGLVTYRIRKRD